MNHSTSTLLFRCNWLYTVLRFCYLLILASTHIFIISGTSLAQSLLATNLVIEDDISFPSSEFSELSILHTSKHSHSSLKTSDLEFGGVFNGFIPGTVTVDPNPAKPRISTGGVILNSQQRGYPAIVRLTITNDDHRKSYDHEDSDNDECDRDENDDLRLNDARTAFDRHGVWNTIVLPRSGTMRRVGGSETMLVDAYKILRNKGTINIGATLHVGANQIRGKYNGTFTITFVCN